MDLFRPISTTFSPNTEPDDISRALSVLLSPWRWKKGKEVQELEGKLREYLGIKYATAFNSGRSSLMAILKSLDLKKGDEILIQAFTCKVAVNPILWQEARPIFVDIDKHLNLDPKDLERKITNRSKAVMVQHTFGWPAQINEIQSICRKNNLFLIEDCAHSLGAKYRGKLVGTFGDAAFFSFGRDKVISSIHGGMAVTNSEKIAQKLREFQKSIPFPRRTWILQQILHPLCFAVCLPIYSLFDLGKGILYLKKVFHILSPSVYHEEKMGRKVSHFPKKLPNALAILALNQLQKLERLNQHRREIVNFYKEDLSKWKQQGKFRFLQSPLAEGDRKAVFMRFPMIFEKSEAILEAAKRKNIFLDDGWRGTPIIPKDVSMDNIGYIRGSCPQVEDFIEAIINLPTSINISQKEAREITSLLSEFIN
ncbi:MAG: aminotransferase class V-fold PLP-dependent enzyme [Candidatus Bathyarchaeota archaeon]|nr:aminotransferase class V-fold PLP-dependent enzyme [Candidatus Bathyarchaeota archaeon]